jgi:hypothetical protein
MFNTSFKIAMQKVMTIKKIKTKTVIAVALVCLAAGTAMAGLYYYGSRQLRHSTPVAQNQTNNSPILQQAQTSNQIGKVLGTCQVCGGKTYCKCDCPSKR